MGSLERVFDINKDVSGKTFECGKLSDLEQIGSEFQILNRLDGNIVRKVKITADSVIIDICDGSEPIAFDKSAKVFYEPRLWDRGSYLIDVPDFGLAVFAVECDSVVPD